MGIYLKLSLAYLRKNKLRTVLLILAVALGVALIFGTSAIRESQNKNDLNAVNKLYGGYHVEFNDLNREEVRKLKNDRDVLKTSTVQNLGNVLDKKGNSFQLKSVDENYVKGKLNKLIKGRLPKNNDEIVLEKKALKAMGIPEKLNSTMDLKIKKKYKDSQGDENVYTEDKKFKLVGIIEKPQKFYDMNLNLEAFTYGNNSIIPEDIISYDSILTLKSGWRNIKGQIKTITKRNDLGKNSYTPNIALMQNTMEIEERGYGTQVIKNQILIVITSAILIFNIFNITLNETIKETGLLRLIGSSKRSVRGMIIYQGLIVMVLGITIGLVFGLIYSYIGISKYNFSLYQEALIKPSLYISKEIIMTSIIAGIISVLASCIIPIIKVSNISIIESTKTTDKMKKHRKFYKLSKTLNNILISKEDKGDNFELAGEVKGSKVIGGMVEFKFDTVSAKRVKFVFKEANQNWASASEFWFYKEDKTLDKMSRLFKDSNMNVVSDEFNTMDKLKALEDECKNHPFYNDFKEDIENAKVVIEQGKLESSVAYTKKFNYLDNKEYINQFRIPYNNIKSISNNAGHYAAQNIEKAVDNDVSTYWETNKSNNNDWNNEITVEFVNPITIDKIVYGARQSDTKGFIEEFEVYGSNTSKGETFQLVSTGKANRDKGLVEAKFKPTTFKRIKLKAVKSNQNWATLNEIMFFKEDKLSDKLNNIFTDQTQSELKKEYNSKEAIDALDKEVKTHPLKSDLGKIIERAHKILDNKFEGNILKMTLPQNGDVHGHCRNDLLMSSFGTNFISTGVLAKPGETIEVYVDADGSKPLPQIMFSQSQGHYGNWQRKYNLKPGYNKFEVPKIYDEKWSHKTNPGGAIYFINPYTTEQQGKAPKIVLEGGQKFPLYNQGDDEQAFLKELKDYSDYVKANPDTAVDIF